MRCIIAVFLVALILTDINGQRLGSTLEDNNSNFKDIITSIEDDNTILNSLSEEDQKRFYRWEWYWRTRVDSSGSFSKLANAMAESSIRFTDIAQTNAKKSTSSFSWESLGPYTRPGGTNKTIGRGLVAAIWVNPSDFDHIIVGASNGGLWESKNGGTNWVCLTENVLLGGVTDLAVDPSNTDVIYLATQVRAANGSMLGLVSQYSLGLFKTTNGGETWTKLNTTGIPTTDIFQKVLIHPTSSSIVFALTTKGIYKSTNSGESWSQVGTYLTDKSHIYYEMAFKPDSPSTIYVSGRNTLYVSTNTGASWTSKIGSLQSVFPDARIQVAVDENNQNLVYAFYSDASKRGINPPNKLEKSLDSGSTWSEVSDDGLQGTGYLTKIWVAPDGDVYAGGVTIRRSSNQGDTFGSSLTSNLIHDDIRDLCFPDPSSNLVYAATDGGVYYSTADGANWQRITGDLALNEFYSVAITEQNPEIIAGGSQDCGSYKRKTDGSWTFIRGGDGGTTLIDQSNHNVYYTTANKRFDRNSSALLYLSHYDTPVEMDPTNSNILYYSKWTTIPGQPPVEVFKSTDQGQNWTSIAKLHNTVTDYAISESDPSTLFFSAWNIWGSTHLYVCPNGTNCQELDYTDINDIVQIAPATNLYVHPLDRNQIWVTFGGFESDKKVYFSDDGGNNWTNHTYTGLPNVPMQSFEYDFLNELLFIGTDIGVFFKSKYDTEWEIAGDLPRVIVTDLKINKASGDLVASTFGRGMYRTNIGEGYCYDEENPITISSTTSWANDSEVCSDITVSSGGTLIIQGTTTMSYLSTIVVQNNATLRISGGKMINGKIEVRPGGHLEIVNNGILKINLEDDLEIAEGGQFDITLGEVQSGVASNE
ncbi:MAG: hypothetical protein CSA96_02845 [Bacteroidetes bacterium]|nr:MAG: hypothetical protein CSA96_02845 [Bacteroidota bacterium]